MVDDDRISRDHPTKMDQVQVMSMAAMKTPEAVKTFLKKLFK